MVTEQIDFMSAEEAREMYDRIGWSPKGFRMYDGYNLASGKRFHEAFEDFKDKNYAVEIDSAAKHIVENVCNTEPCGCILGAWRYSQGYSPYHHDIPFKDCTNYETEYVVNGFDFGISRWRTSDAELEDMAAFQISRFDPHVPDRCKEIWLRAARLGYTLTKPEE